MDRWFHGRCPPAARSPGGPRSARAATGVPPRSRRAGSSPAGPGRPRPVPPRRRSRSRNRNRSRRRRRGRRWRRPGRPAGRLPEPGACTTSTRSAVPSATPLRAAPSSTTTTGTGSREAAAAARICRTSRPAAAGRSRHQPSGRDPTTLAASTSSMAPEYVIVDRPAIRSGPRVVVGRPRSADQGRSAPDSRPRVRSWG